MTTATPSLSSLQAALRKPPVAKSPAPKQGQPVAQGTKRPISAEEAGSGAPPLKKVLVKTATGATVVKFVGGVAKAPMAKGVVAKSPGSVAKAPAPGNVAKSAPGTLAKAPAGGAPQTPVKAPPQGTIAKAPGMVAKSVGSVAKVPGTLAKSPSGMAPLVKASSTGIVKAKAPLGTVATNPGEASQDGGLSLARVGEVVAAIEAAPGGAKIRSVVRLADALGQSLPIEHINHFLRAMRKKVAERAQADGMHVPAIKAPQASVQVTNGKPAVTAAVAPAKPPAPALAAVLSKPGTVAKVAPPKAPVVSKPKPAQPPPQPKPASAAPAASSPPSGDDPLYALVGELVEDPVCTDGALNEARLTDVLKRLWDGVARKPKDWIVGWQAMTIPVDKQGEALQKFLNMAFTQADDSEKAPMVVAELVKAHKVKMRSVEEVLVAFGNDLDGMLALSEEAWHIYAQFLVHVFPKPAAAGWGWSRVGWSWQSWWKFVEQCIQTLEGSRASDVLCMILRLIQEREGQALQELPGWADGDKLQRFVSKISELGACEASEAIEKLGIEGVVVSA